jgi:hypothetical protein
MLAQVLKLAGRNEDKSRSHIYGTRPFAANFYTHPLDCIAAQRIAHSDSSNVMAFKHLLQTSFVQSILSFLPTLRHSIEAPQPAEAATPPPAPASVEVEPWKEEVDRWKLLADKTVAERDQLRQEAGRLHVEMQRLVHDLGQVRVEAEEMWKNREEEMRREKDEVLRETEEKMKREAEDATRKAQENVQRVQDDLKELAAELEESKREQTGLRATLDTRRAELEALQQVVGSDKLGETDVVQLVKNLNEEIARTGKAARDIFKLDRNSRSNGKVVTDAASAIEGWVGSALPGLLSTQYRGNAVLLQAAVQAMAVAFSSWISTSYSFMHEHDQILDETYKFVMNSGICFCCSIHAITC